MLGPPHWLGAWVLGPELPLHLVVIGERVTGGSGGTCTGMHAGGQRGTAQTVTVVLPGTLCAQGGTPYTVAAEG